MQPARRIVAAGGGTRVDDWVQALADCTDLPVDVLAVPESGALGTAFLARVAAGSRNVDGRRVALGALRPHASSPTRVAHRVRRPLRAVPRGRGRGARRRHVTCRSPSRRLAVRLVGLLAAASGVVACGGGTDHPKPTSPPEETAPANGTTSATASGSQVACRLLDQDDAATLFGTDAEPVARTPSVPVALASVCRWRPSATRSGGCRSRWCPTRSSTSRRRRPA